jgi:hypothetical protein
MWGQPPSAVRRAAARRLLRQRLCVERRFSAALAAAVSDLALIIFPAPDISLAHEGMSPQRIRVNSRRGSFGFRRMTGQAGLVRCCTGESIPARQTPRRSTPRQAASSAIIGSVRTSADCRSARHEFIGRASSISAPKHTPQRNPQRRSLPTLTAQSSTPCLRRHTLCRRGRMSLPSAGEQRRTC